MTNQQFNNLKANDLLIFENDNQFIIVSIEFINDNHDIFLLKIVLSNFVDKDIVGIKNNYYLRDVVKIKRYNILDMPVSYYEKQLIFG